MMKRFSLRMAAAVALSTLMTSAPSALAADLLPPPPPPPEIRTSVYDWSGAYVGGMISGVMVDATYVPLAGPDPNLDGDGVLGGVYAGYNYQMGNFVLGIEGDAQFGEVNPNNLLDNVDQDIDFMATIRGRLGYAHDRTMAYFTGGVAFMDSEIILPGFGGESDSKSHTGYVLGGGLEHAWTDNMVGRIEYLFASFDTKQYDFAPGSLNYDPDDIHMVRFGGAWKF